MSRLQSRAFRSPGFWVVCVAGVAAFAANFNSDALNGASGPPKDPVVPIGKFVSMVSSPASQTDSLLREDTKLSSVRGQFLLNNGRYEFLEEGASKPLKCLENLWLQRVVDAQKGSTRKSTWSVNLTIKEFGDENFVLIETASKAR